MKQGRSAAFFDFDRTLLTRDSAAIGLRYLWEMGLVPLSYILKALAANVFYQRHILPEHFMARILLPFYQGKRLDTFEDGVCEFYENLVKPHFAPNILSRLKEHQQKGHFTALVSGGVRYSLKPVIKDLGMNFLLCTDLETDDEGFLTGKTSGPLCIHQAKADLVMQLASEHGIDLASSWAYGNHQNDIPMMELVGNPVAVAPTGPLKRHAIKKGWPVMEHY
jgi:HAD superfamily hydrolase (TIGR01490 family)